MSNSHQPLLFKVEISSTEVSNRIYALRGLQVMIDSDLAELYEVETKVLKQAVRRNQQRFPSDFMFALERYELDILRSQFVTSRVQELMKLQKKCDTDATVLRSQIVTSKIDDSHGGNRYMPFAFTESGVAMLSSVLRSEKAVQINISIMRVFVHLRTRMTFSQNDLVPKLDILQSSLTKFENKLDQFGTKLDAEKKSAHKVQDPNKVKAIKDAVAKYWGLHVDDLNSSSRTKVVVLARQVAIFMMRKRLDMSYIEIGHHFGKRHHSTIMHSYRKIHVDAEDNKIVREAIANLQAAL